jgi:hypothetical protein
MRLDRNLAEWEAGNSSLRVLSDFMHELTHYQCMYSIVGNSLTLLWLRSTRVSDGRSLEQKAADVAKVVAFQTLMRPWLEGMAMFAEFDATPGNSEIISKLMTETIRHFIRGEDGPWSKALTDPEQRDGAICTWLANYRFSPVLIRRKADFLLSPLSTHEGGYLAGYLCVRAFQERCASVSDLGLDTDFVLTYLAHLLMDDFALVDILLADHDDPVNAIQAVEEHVISRMMSMASQEFAEAVATDMKYFERANNVSIPSASDVGSYNQVLDHIFSSDRRSSAMNAFAEALRVASDDADRDLLEARAFFIVGSSTGTASFLDDGRTFVFDYGEDKTSELESFIEMPPGDHPAELTVLIAPAFAASAYSISTGNSVLSINYPDQFVGTVFEEILRRRSFHRDGSMDAIKDREQILVRQLEVSGRMHQILTALSTADQRVEAYYHGHGLTPAVESELQFQNVVNSMMENGIWDLVHRRRDLVLTLSLLSIARSNLKGRLIIRSMLDGKDPLEAQAQAFGVHLNEALETLIGLSDDTGVAFAFHDERTRTLNTWW